MLVNVCSNKKKSASHGILASY